MNKLTDEELKEFVSASEDYHDARDTVATLSIQQFKANFVYTTAEERLKEVRSKVSEKYGNITVNLETGEYHANT